MIAFAPIAGRPFASPAAESVVDAHAARVLRDNSPADVRVDPSLGPYVTSSLRRSADDDEAALESLTELLQEQCVMDRDRAASALRRIRDCVRAGSTEADVPDEALASLGRALSGVSHPSTTTTTDESVFCFEGDDERTTDEDISFLPADLWGALDGPLDPQQQQHHHHQDQEPPPSQLPSTDYPKKPSLSKETLAQDLATSLFRPRSRSNSMTTATISTAPSVPNNNNNNNNNYYRRPDHGPAVHMLLSINADLSEEAARAAVSLADNDVNVAQYVVERARDAPPVCRHALHDGCYRADCQFDHDVAHHTCAFWLRGRCGKDDCRFRHGFSERALEGMVCPRATITNTNNAVAVETRDLLEHNLSASPGARPASWEGGFSRSGAYYSLPLFHHRPRVPPPQVAPRQPRDDRDYPTIQETTTAATTSSTSSSYPPLKTVSDAPRSSPRRGPASFARVASQGYDRVSSFAVTSDSKAVDATSTSKPQDSSSSSSSKQPYALVPSDLFAPRLRDPCSSARPRNRSDVVDLRHHRPARDATAALDAIMATRALPCWILAGRRSAERATARWLAERGYDAVRGRDARGHHVGALLVRGRRR